MPVNLVPVDAVEVTVLVDNAIDILAAADDVARRPALTWDWSKGDQLRAEHGYSLLVTTTTDGVESTILYDAGLGETTMVHNLDLLGRKLKDVRAMVLSHGHADHHGGLQGMFKQLGRFSMPLVVHPDVWRDRKVVFPNGAEIEMPPPNHQDLDREGWQVIEERGPTLLLDGAVMVTGQVERTTDYEKGFPIQVAKTAGGGWEPDTWIWDDQAVVINVRDAGLVVLSSCSHAGAINVLRHARTLTGVDKVHAFMGGMHLTGGLFEKIIDVTVDDLVALSPDIVVPGHCTGWRATSTVIRKLGNAYRPSNVGTTYRFAAPDQAG